MNCDPLARVYRVLEYLAFGTRLERQRFVYLGEANSARRALLLGEGDGRFLSQLAYRNTYLEIDCVEISREMIAAAQRRVNAANLREPSRIRFHECDALLYHSSSKRYDFVVTHFFLDCLSTETICRVVPTIRSMCVPGTKWLITEFQVPEQGWRRLHARLWLRIMYWFFRKTTGLKVQRLPNYRKALIAAGFSMSGRKLMMADFISAELWELPRFSSAETGNRTAVPSD